MFILSNETKIQNLDVSEYFFLSENFEFTDPSEIENGVGYLVSNKRNNLIKTVQSIIENELDETEKQVIKLYYYDGIDTVTVAKMCNIARSSVYRNINSALKKIESSIKYVMFYEDLFSAISAEELVKSIKGGTN